MAKLVPTLKGPSVTLRPMTEPDLRWEYRWMNDDDLLKLVEVNYPVNYTYENVRSIFEGALRGEECILVIEDAGKKPVGDVWLHPINFVHKHAEVVIQLGDRNCWGKGLARQALQLILHHAFEGLELHRVEADVLGANHRALRFFERQGFSVEGVKREHLQRDEKWFDVVLLAMLKTEFRGARKSMI